MGGGAPLRLAHRPPARRPGVAARRVVPHPVPSRRVSTDADLLAVVHMSAECWPFARTGGLGEAVSCLVAQQAAGGQAAAVVMPLYGAVRDAGHAVEPITRHFEVRVGARRELVRLLRSADAGERRRVFFIEHPAFSERSGLYGESGADHPDNLWRFALFTMAALRVLPWIAPTARVLHAHDWHTALAPAYLRTSFADSAFHRRLAVVLSVHNAGFQGHGPPETMAALGLPAALYDWRLFEWYGRVNLLKGGVALADLVTTVSPTHAAELRTRDSGFGLHGTFAALGERLVGILNGIDQHVWTPATDPHIPARFTAAEPARKTRCKAALERAFGLPQRPETPLIAMCARLAAQKGLDLLLGSGALDAREAQFVFLGEGEERYRRALAERAAAAPERIAVRFDFHDRLEHLLMAGADLLLIPSVYEPCGLTQMRAQRYGAIPIAHRIGGLAHTIEDGRTGFLFSPYTAAALQHALARGLSRHADRAGWSALVRAAMARDFGWERPARQYLDVYRRALGIRDTEGAAAAITLSHASGGG